MPPAEVIKAIKLQRVLISGQVVECRFVRSKAAKKLRIKVKPDGVEVVLPEGRDVQDGCAFISENQDWVMGQLARARQLRSVRRLDKPMRGQVMFRGEPVPVNVVRVDQWLAQNKVVLEDGAITITCGPDARIPAPKSLENWLRKQAREVIEKHLVDVCKRVKRRPNRIYVMGQRTKWGNCSALGNLSFNWRLIMAPDFVAKYLVTHEMVHLVVPDHSQRFWLTVQSFCPESEKARQWLTANGQKLFVDLNNVLIGEK